MAQYFGWRCEIERGEGAAENGRFVDVRTIELRRWIGVQDLFVSDKKSCYSRDIVGLEGLGGEEGLCEH